jgi:hypothetical protein
MVVVSCRRTEYEEVEKTASGAVDDLLMSEWEGRKDNAEAQRTRRFAEKNRIGL